MCINCDCSDIPYTESDLKIDFRNETGYHPENQPRMYIEWLERKVIKNRNQENNVCKANEKIQKVLYDDLNEDKLTDEVIC